MIKDKTKRRIWVRTKHILMGRQGEPRSCPVALAIREQLNMTAEQITVSGRIRIGYNYQNMPLPVSRFIVNFDRGGLVRPFSFLIEVPDEDDTER